MPSDILTVSNLARHVHIKAQHDYWEKQFHISRERILLALQDFRIFSQDGYAAVIKEYERKVLQQKLFGLDHPDLHEEYSKIITIRQLIVTGPEESPTPVSGVHPDLTPRPKRDLQQVIADLMEPGEEIIPAQPLLTSSRPKGYIRTLIEQQMGPAEESLDKT